MTLEKPWLQEFNHSEGSHTVQRKHIALFSRTCNVNQKRIGINLLTVTLLEYIKQKSESSTEAEGESRTIIVKWCRETLLEQMTRCGHWDKHMRRKLKVFPLRLQPRLDDLRGKNRHSNWGRISKALTAGPKYRGDLFHLLMLRRSFAS
jgi:hypothetical protein